uniref:RING-type domain-containing protein n=1 Tax=viral metagenome TaxID=1070528 RepID=A0A6C0E1K5_9ZZZZ
MERNNSNCKICGHLCENTNSNKCIQCNNFFHTECIKSEKNNNYKCNICKGIEINNFQIENRKCDLCKKEYEFKINCKVNKTKITMTKNNEKYCESCYIFIQSIPNPYVSENEDVLTFSLSPTLRALSIPDDEILTPKGEEEKKKDGKKKKSKRLSTKRKKSLKYKSNTRKK